MIGFRWRSPTSHDCCPQATVSEIEFLNNWKIPQNHGFLIFFMADHPFLTTFKGVINTRLIPSVF